MKEQKDIIELFYEFMLEIAKLQQHLEHHQICAMFNVALGYLEPQHRKSEYSGFEGHLIEALRMRAAEEMGIEYDPNQRKLDDSVE